MMRSEPMASKDFPFAKLHVYKLLASPSWRVIPKFVKGCYWDLYCLAATSEPRGSLYMDGEPMTDEDIAGWLGESLEAVLEVLGHLKKRRHLARDSAGGWFFTKFAKHQRNGPLRIRKKVPDAGTKQPKENPGGADVAHPRRKSGVQNKNKNKIQDEDVDIRTRTRGDGRNKDGPRKLTFAEHMTYFSNRFDSYAQERLGLGITKAERATLRNFGTHLEGLAKQQESIEPFQRAMNLIDRATTSPGVREPKLLFSSLMVKEMGFQKKGKEIMGA